MAGLELTLYEGTTGWQTMGYEEIKRSWPCSTVPGIATPKCSGKCQTLSTSLAHKFDLSFSTGQNWFVEKASSGEAQYWHTQIPAMDWITQELTLEQSTNHANVLFQALAGLNAHGFAALGNYGPDMVSTSVLNRDCDPATTSSFHRHYSICRELHCTTT